MPAKEKPVLTPFIESLPDGLILFSAENHLVCINKRARHFLDIKKDLPTAYEITVLLERRFDFRSRLEESLKLNHPVRLEAVSFREFILRILIVPISDAVGNRPVGLAVILYDCTAEKKIEKLREDFSAMMVHELRAPLTAVHGISDTLIKDYAVMKKEDIEVSLRLIHDSSANLLTLVNDLLDVAKLESGKFEIIKEEADLRPLLRERIDFFRPSAKEKGLVLELDVPPNSLPKLSFDIVRLGHVLNNLISNAIKFTKAGQINVAAKLGEGEIIVSVKDTGSGISPEEIAQLFSKYKQLKQPPFEGQRGTGLGLVVVKGIIEAHGGRVWVKSRVGEGSVFYFSLPL